MECTKNNSEYEKIDEDIIFKKDLNKRAYNLSFKIEHFLEWYCNNIVDNDLLDYDKFIEKTKVKNFIEKMAIWYELRYPNYGLDKIMDTEPEDNENINKNIDNIMFYDNSKFNNYVNIRWADFYNTKVFINSLPAEEKQYLDKPRYKEFIFIDFLYQNYYWDIKVYFNSKGKITKFVRGYCNITSLSLFKTFIGLSVDEFLEAVRKKDIIINENSRLSLNNSILEYENKKYMKDELLNCVMYRIIERGGEYYGPRRGYLFAKEFNRNIDIPMIYGNTNYEWGLKEFYNMYLKDGGSTELKCLRDYFSWDYVDDNFVTVKEILNNCYYHTNEEIELGQRLVNVLSSRSQALNQIIKYDEKNQREEVNNKRLQRKLDKSKNRRN